MEHVTGTDIFILSVLLLSGLLSCSRGFVSEMLGIGSWFLASAAGFYAMPYLAPYALRYISNPLLANLASVVAASIAALVVLTLICSKITLKVKKSVLNRLDHFLGLLFGLLRGLIILVLLYFIILTLAPKSMPELRKDSKLTPYLEAVTEHVRDQLPESLFDTPTTKEDGDNLDELFEKLNDMKAVKGKAKAPRKKAPEPVAPAVEEPVAKPVEEVSETPVAPDEVPDIPDEVIVNEGEALFKLLNAPEVGEKSGGAEGYGRQEREDLDRLIMENIDETGSVVP